MASVHPSSSPSSRPSPTPSSHGPDGPNNTNKPNGPNNTNTPNNTNNGGGGDTSSSDVKDALDQLITQIGQQILSQGQKAYSDMKEDMDDGS